MQSMPAIDKLIKSFSVLLCWQYINTSSETWFICLGEKKTAKSHRTLTWTMTNFWLWQRCQQPKISPTLNHLSSWRGPGFQAPRRSSSSAGETLPAKLFQSYFWLRSTKHTQSGRTQRAQGVAGGVRKPQTKLSPKTNFILMRSDSIRCCQTETEKETYTETRAQFKF